MFHTLFIKSVQRLTGQSVKLTLAVPPDLRDTFDFKPGQFVTLRAQIDGVAVRRSYSLCSGTPQLSGRQELAVGIKQVEGGVFSNWAQGLQPGDTLDVMPPDGRFITRNAAAQRRLLVAAGSGITPMLSMLHSWLAEPGPGHTHLIYGNRGLSDVMFLDELQDLKDRDPERLSVRHVWSRQHQDLPLLHGRIDGQRLQQLLAGWVDVATLDEAFVCGPEGVIDATETTLVALGMPRERIHHERFGAATSSIANNAQNTATPSANQLKIPLEITLDGVQHSLALEPDQTVLEAGLAAGLDLPYSCTAGVCCTCRAKVLEGQLAMARNFTLEAAEVNAGFVLTCQARAVSARVAVSFDER